MSKRILYEGQFIEVSDEIAAFFEEERKRKAAWERRESRSHLITKTYVPDDYYHFLTKDALPNHVVKNLALEQLHKEIGALPEKDRTLLHMRYWQGKTMQEIGDVLGVSKMAISKRLKRIERQLYERIANAHK